MADRRFLDVRARNHLVRMGKGWDGDEKEGFVIRPACRDRVSYSCIFGVHCFGQVFHS